MMELLNKHIERFWRKVKIGADDDCWLWVGMRNSWNYGEIKIRGKKYGAHRISWMINKGEIPDDLWVLHRCDNPPCVNPNHLFLGTNLDNIADRTKKGRSAKGRSHGWALHPDKILRGDKSPHRLHPESYLGEKNGASKLTETMVIEIRALSKHEYTQKEIAQMFHVSLPTIQRAISHKTWKHIKEA